MGVWDSIQSSWPKFKSQVKDLFHKDQEITEVQIVVEEMLRYKAYIGERTFIDESEIISEGTIEVLIPKHSKKQQAKYKKKIVSDKKPYGYLALSEYKATTWDPPLKTDGVPLKIPIYPVKLDKHHRSSIKFKYLLDPEVGIISSRPIFLDAEIVDGSGLDGLQEFGVSFLDTLRLQLNISSEASYLTQQDVERIVKALEIESENVKEDAEKLQNQLKEKNKKKKKDEMIDDSEIIEIKENLNKAKEKREELESLLEGRKKRVIKQQDLLAKIPALQDKHNLSSLTQLINELFHKVQLSYIEFKTPYIRHFISTEIERSIDKFKTVWLYNPQRKTLELRKKSPNLEKSESLLEKLSDLYLIWNKDKNLYELKFYLDIISPIKDLPELEGCLVLRIDEPISKLQVDWASEEGPEIDEKIVKIYRTWLVLDFEIDMAEVFAKRSFSARRRLHFEGVVFQNNHLDNIRHILSNHQLTVLPYSNFNNNEGKSFSETIFAIRQGAYEDHIVAKVVGQVRQGKHTITYNKKQETLTRTISLGTLDVDLWVKMSGHSNVANRLLDEVQIDLEQYFTSVTAAALEES
ncbi:MAG: hypothetical protein KDJ52_08020 [Anaerolineae bacterium]|nr:hypothetical protein [Anaerolineae bacterium]